MTGKRNISTGDAAKRIGVDPATVWRWIAAGKLAAFRTPGGHWRIDAKEVERLRRTK